MLDKYIELRRAADVPTSDAMDVMLSQGYDNQTIIGVRNIHYSIIREMNASFRSSLLVLFLQVLSTLESTVGATCAGYRSSDSFGF